MRFPRFRHVLATIALFTVVAAVLASGLGAPDPDVPEDRAPDVLVISVDTLRADRLTTYGYERPTSPNLERIFADGVWFDHARTVEPLTSPALCSMITSRPPHEHGSSRNGLRLRPGLESLPKELRYRGYRTAAFVGNWTLRNKLSGLAEHFDEYREILSRARWFGLVRAEATADDLNRSMLEWLASHTASSDRPVFAWVHYVEPHAPYRNWREYGEALGVDARNAPPADRYDTEIAYVDDAIGRLVERAGRLLHDPVIVFLSDHGESLGEHDYWGHGRNLYEPTLRIPMAIAWGDRLSRGRVAGPALITDIAPTVLGLIGGDVPDGFSGFDWTGVLTAGAEPPTARVTHYQAHRGAVMSRHESDLARRSGVIEVGLIDGPIKETFRTQRQVRRVFDLSEDPGELHSRTAPKDNPSEALDGWMREVFTGLTSFDADATPEPLDEESAANLKSLGYID
jgi:arylsulfatase A-like enzyme